MKEKEIYVTGTCIQIEKLFSQTTNFVYFIKYLSEIVILTKIHFQIIPLGKVFR
jgi:hypothetical protein